MYAYQQWTEHERRNSLSGPGDQIIEQSHSESDAQRLESWAFEHQLKVHDFYLWKKKKKAEEMKNKEKQEQKFVALKTSSSKSSDTESKFTSTAQRSAKLPSFEY